ncbi:MAG: F0F1 ATP synthase subunit B [Bacillota bacterium]|nr:F0F1 ATP synthase subunit B [Bacillota bacterium]
MLKLGLVEFGWSTVFQIVNTIILYLVLKKFLFVPVTEFIQGRQDEIKNSYDDADKKNEKAESLKKEYEEKLDNVKQEGQEILIEAQKKADERGSEIIKESKEEASKLKEKAEKDIEFEKKKALNDMKDEISNIAMMAASKVLGNEVDENKNKQLVDDFIKEVGESRWQN